LFFRRNAARTSPTACSPLTVPRATRREQKHHWRLRHFFYVTLLAQNQIWPYMQIAITLRGRNSSSRYCIFGRFFVKLTIYSASLLFSDEHTSSMNGTGPLPAFLLCLKAGRRPFTRLPNPFCVCSSKITVRIACEIAYDRIMFFRFLLLPVRAVSPTCSTAVQAVAFAGKNVPICGQMFNRMLQSGG